MKMEKKCTKCNTTKSLDEFSNDKSYKNGKRPECKECRNAYIKSTKKQWIPQENELIKCKHCLEEKLYTFFSKRGKQKPYQCKDCRNKNDLLKRNTGNNREEHNRKQREYWSKNNEYLTAKKREILQKRRDTDPEYNIRMCLHVRLNQAVSKKCDNTMHIVGCSLKELMKYLESKFIEGMTWENHGLHGWHIDHIRPCCSFNLKDPEEQKKCFHYTNLQPLWAKDNLKKGGKYECVKTT